MPPCHTCPPVTHTPGHACPPCHTCPQPMHAPTMHAPHHAHPSATHAPLPHPPAMHTPCHACPPSHAHPPGHACSLATHAPSSHTCIPPAMHASPPVDRITDTCETRLHSSRMRTTRMLTVSPSMLCVGVGGWCTWSRGVYLAWGVYLVLGGVPGLGGYLVQGGVPGLGVPGPRGVPGPGGVPGLGDVPGPGGCTWFRGCTWSQGVPGQVLPPVDRITDTCKNITLPQLRCGHTPRAIFFIFMLFSAKKNCQIIGFRPNFT